MRITALACVLSVLLAQSVGVLGLVRVSEGQHRYTNYSLVQVEIHDHEDANVIKELPRDVKAGLIFFVYLEFR